MNAPSRRNGPMKSIMFRVMRNGTLCPSMRPMNQNSRSVSALFQKNGFDKYTDSHLDYIENESLE